jgi:hypothetical protein
VSASGGDDDATGASFSVSVVTALAAVELRRETRLWMAMMYKNTSQHRRSVHFQRMRGVTRSLRALAALDVGTAAAALRDGLRDGVSEEAREAALSSPAVAAGAHVLWKLPPRALWDDLSRRLQAVARVATEADDAIIAAGESLVGQLAHTFFMPFALVALAALARLRAATHQLIADTVAAYNTLAPLLRGGVMPPPGLESGPDQERPEALVCEWVTVSPLKSASSRVTRTAARKVRRGSGDEGSRAFATRASRGNEETKTAVSCFGTNGGAGETFPKKSAAVSPRARSVPWTSGALDATAIGDEDWSWRVLRPVARTLETRDDVFQVNPSTEKHDGDGTRDGKSVVVGEEDLGAAVPRRARGVEAKVDRGVTNPSIGNVHAASLLNGDRERKSIVPSYSRATFTAGLGMVSTTDAANSETATKTSEEREDKETTPSFDFESLASGLARTTTDAIDPDAAKRASKGNKKRRRPGASSVEPRAPAEETPAQPGGGKKKKKKKNGDPVKSDPKSAVERAMALLLGD